MALSVKVKMWWCAWAVAAWWCAAAGGCDVTVDGRSYTEEVLASGVQWVYGLAMDYSTGAVYFSYYNRSWHSAKLDLKTKALTVIEELTGWCAFTVNQALQELHAGCRTYDYASGGLYQWDSNTGRFELAGEAGRAVTFAHYNDGKVYYSYAHDFLLRSFSNGHSVLQPAPTAQVWRLVVKSRGEWIFTNYTGVYRRRWDGAGAGETQYEGIDYWVWALAADRRGAAYICDNANPSGVWRLHDGPAPAATQLLDAGCTALSHDADGNVIYADNDRSVIVRLLPC